MRYSRVAVHHRDVIARVMSAHPERAFRGGAADLSYGSAQRCWEKIDATGMATLFLRNGASRFDIAGDKSQFDFIVQDMVRNGGDLAPSDVWNWNMLEDERSLTGYTSELYEKRYNHLTKILEGWAGILGMQALSERAVRKYEGYLRSIDHLQLLPPDIFAHGRDNGWIEVDLGSVLDLNLITWFLANRATQRLAVCEVGGGYGRLAEVFLEKYGGRLHYLMIDAVPASLMYAYSYLRAQYPELKIGSYYAGDHYDDSYNCYILPAWHTGVLKDAVFDVCVNVESMQEMQQHHVDFYLETFDRLAASGAEIYLSNARDYFFKGQWNIPPHWETLYLNNTPRSWTADHPTHILRKGNTDYSLQRSARESAFQQQVEAWVCP